MTVDNMNVAAHDAAAPPTTPPTVDADGAVVVRLITEVGEADIRVPPQKAWRSSARHALFTAGDDLSWAHATLSEADAKEWAELDPTNEEAEKFFRDWGRATGAAGNRSERRRRNT
jgi:hypothetical protein